MQVFAQIGVQASAADTEVLIRCQAAGAPRITCAALSTLLLADRSRLLAAELPCRRGAFVAGEAAAGVRECKIVYPQCKTPAFTPSSWAEAGVGAACVARSSAVPDTRLQLEFVYGYEGVNNTGSNVFYNCQRQVRVRGGRACPALMLHPHASKVRALQMQEGTHMRHAAPASGLQSACR